MRDAFTAAGRPLSAREVMLLAQEMVPSIGIATAYRAIKDLVESGWLVPVATPAGGCFELAAIDRPINDQDGERGGKGVDDGNM